jgi:hypothetical protein
MRKNDKGLRTASEGQNSPGFGDNPTQFPTGDNPRAGWVRGRPLAAPQLQEATTNGGHVPLQNRKAD